MSLFIDNSLNSLENSWIGDHPTHLPRNITSSHQE